MTTETTPMQDFSTCCDGRVEMTNEGVLGVAREYLGSSLHDGYVSSRALKLYILLNATLFIKFRSFKR
jgi:hypothetical protein